MKDLVLIVDDEDINRIVLERLLEDTYEIMEARDGVEALNVLNKAPRLPSIILLDILMPNMNGHEFIIKVKSDYVTRNIPILFITTLGDEKNETAALREGAVDYIVRPFNEDVVKSRVMNHIKIDKYRRNLELKVEDKSSEVTSLHMKMLDTLATIIEYRSLESGMHIQRTMELTRVMIEALRSKTEYRDRLAALNYDAIIKAVPLHDVGKVGIPDRILLKPGKLSTKEFEVIKTHTSIGGNIIDTVAEETQDEQMYLKHSKDIAMYHHERWDGGGYCAGLNGENIPLSARIVSVVDVYDALISKRCYKEGFSYDDTISIIKSGRGAQFDPNLVDAFLEISGEFKAVTDRLRDE